MRSWVLLKKTKLKINLHAVSGVVDCKKQFVVLVGKIVFAIKVYILTKLKKKSHS